MTAIPIDYRRRPWRTKYILDETFLFNTWFIFGEYPDGSVCITDGNADIMEYVPRDVAEEIISKRDEFCNFLRSKLCNWDEDGQVPADHPWRTKK